MTSTVIPNFPTPLPSYVSQYSTSQVSSACSCLSVKKSTQIVTASYSTVVSIHVYRDIHIPPFIQALSPLLLLPPKNSLSPPSPKIYSTTPSPPQPPPPPPASAQPAGPSTPAPTPSRANSPTPPFSPSTRHPRTNAARSVIQAPVGRTPAAWFGLGRLR